MRTWNIHNAWKTLYSVYKDRRRIVELLQQLENKQQIMQNNVETQHNRMYSLYIGSLCNVAFPLARFTCIMTSQVLVEIWMRWSIALSSAFYTGIKHLWIVFSFKVRYSVSIIHGRLYVSIREIMNLNLRDGVDIVFTIWLLKLFINIHSLNSKFTIWQLITWRAFFENRLGMGRWKDKLFPGQMTGR